jgi:hypothetical protein
MPKTLWELSLHRPDGVLYFRTIALSMESARAFAAKDDSCWLGDAVTIKSISEVHGDDRLIAMRMIAFVPSAKCPTCGK